MWGMFVAKYSLPEKNNFIPAYAVKVYSRVEEKYFKDTTSPNPLPMRITQTTGDRILGN